MDQNQEVIEEMYSSSAFMFSALDKNVSRCSSHARLPYI